MSRLTDLLRDDPSSAPEIQRMIMVAQEAIAGIVAALEAAIADKADEASAVMDGDGAGGVLSGTYPNPGFAVDMATQAELTAHIDDTTGAHAASAISYDGGDVETTLDGLVADVAAISPVFFIGDDAPVDPPSQYAWIETGLGGGADWTMWIETGA